MFERYHKIKFKYQTIDYIFYPPLIDCIDRNGVYFLMFARALFYTDLVSTLKISKATQCLFKKKQLLLEIFLMNYGEVW